MKIKMTALELILHLADGSTTPNTLQHITKIAKATLNEMKDREEMQPFIDLTNESYLRGVHDGRIAEREACAKLVDDIEARCTEKDVDDPPLNDIAAAIRARSNT